MDRKQFNQALRSHIKDLPEDEIAKSLGYFDEMIDDRIEDGMSEKEAIADLGNVRDIAEKIKSEEPLLTKVKGKLGLPKDITPWGWTLIIVGSPLWLAIGVTLIAVPLSLLITAIALTAAGILALAVSAVHIVSEPAVGLWQLGWSCICIGLGLILLQAMLQLGKVVRRKFSQQEQGGER